MGVMHRNLKPENILLEKSGRLVLADFTMSRIFSQENAHYTPEDPKERERSGREARRLWYRAPELLLRRCKYSKEIDMWSIGCILAELATSIVLFEGESEIE
jgi:cyclin-dependent kinase